MPWLGNDEFRSMSACFENNWITEGPVAKKFCNELLALTGAKYGVLAPNGTLALYMALKSIGIEEGDEVIVPDFTFIGSANAIEMAGGVPVFIDVNKKNFQIDLSDADQLITARTKAIMPVHIYGSVADMDAVCRFAQKHRLLIIEDAAQAIGVHYKGKHAGTFGNAGTFSFFADKTITTGEGGFVVTNDEIIYNKLLYLRNQGRKERGTFIHPEIGYNFRMTDFQCAIGLTQLSKLEEIKKRKLAIKEIYFSLLRGVKQVNFFSPEKDVEWIPFRIAILCENALELMKYMDENEIEVRTFFYPLHLQPCYQHLPGNDENKAGKHFPNSVFAYNNGICLPTFPALKEEEIQYICYTIKEFYAEK